MAALRRLQSIPSDLQLVARLRRGRESVSEEWPLTRAGGRQEDDDDGAQEDRLGRAVRLLFLADLRGESVAPQELARAFGKLRPLVLDGLEHLMHIGSIGMQTALDGHLADARGIGDRRHERPPNQVRPEAWSGTGLA